MTTDKTVRSPDGVFISTDLEHPYRSPKSPDRFVTKLSPITRSPSTLLPHPYTHSLTPCDTDYTVALIRGVTQTHLYAHGVRRPTATVTTHTHTTDITFFSQPLPSTVSKSEHSSREGRTSTMHTHNLSRTRSRSPGPGARARTPYRRVITNLGPEYI